MIDAFVDALHKGLPYPILTVAEYLSLNEEGFCWGKIYRKAGYFSCIALWYVFFLPKIPFIAFLSLNICNNLSLVFRATGFYLAYELMEFPDRNNFLSFYIEIF